MRADQALRQGSGSGTKDAGARAAVTGGAQMDGFVRIVRDLLYERGLPLGTIHHEGRIEIPGWYRSEKKWDLLVIVEGIARRRSRIQVANWPFIWKQLQQPNGGGHRERF